MENFLEELERKLNVIDEKERKKIIKNYQRQIEEKIHDGKSEEEAINELGDIDEVAKEICETYHVNFKNRKKNFREVLNEGIENVAIFLADTTRDIINYSKENTKNKLGVTFFEILLKILILIMAFMVLKLPFIILEEGIETVSDLLFYPFNNSLNVIFEYIISVIYLALCIAASIYLFKGYFTKDTNVVLADKKEDKKEEETLKKPNYAIMIIKMIIMVVVMIPMILLNILFLLLTVLAIYLVFKGVALVGLSILLLTLSLLSGVMTATLSDAIDNKNRSHLFALTISIISLIIGIVLFVNDLMSYNYPKTLEDSHFPTLTETIDLEVDKETNLYFPNGKAEYIIDDSIKDNIILLEVTYYDDFVDIIVERQLGEEKNNFVVMSRDDDLDVGDYVFMYETILEDLKDNNLFKYDDLDQYKVTVYCNTKTEELLNK